jgi:hypothetical protein
MRLRLADHSLDAHDRALAIMKGARDILRQALDNALVLPAQLLVAEAGEKVFLV